MKTKLFILCCWCSGALCAQKSAIDSLQKTAAKEQNKAAKATLYLLLAEKTANLHLDTSFYYASAALATFKERNESAKVPEA